MIKNIPLDKMILAKWLKAGFIEKNKYHTTDAGTPQGGIISPVLANMTLDGLEDLLHKSFPMKIPKRKIRNPKINLIRYADDFVITGESKELLEQQVKPLVEKFLLERGLLLSPEKTKITNIEEGFDFLGQNLRKYDGKMLIKPSKKNAKNFLDKIRGKLYENKTLTQENMINSLNPIIRGWANYHRWVASSRSFSRASHMIWKSLWRWCIKRHPNKGLRWIKARYFKTVGADRWVFSCKHTSKRGVGLRLLMPVDIKIRKHIKIRTTFNPFDQQWEEYLVKRKVMLKIRSASGVMKTTFRLNQNF